MGQISDITNPWRTRLLSAPASFRGIAFHVESSTLSGGRRTVVHEYPKRNDPYSEDMGRHALRWTFNGYLIYKPTGAGTVSVFGAPLPTPYGERYDYVQRRIDLVGALDQDDAGMLIHPVFCAGGKMVMCERYSVTETREKGGYTTFEMSFVFAGSPGNAGTTTNTSQNVFTTAANAVGAAITGFGGVIAG